MAREWDCRFNLPTPEDLQEFLDAVKAEDAKGKFRFVLVGGVEIGDRPFQTDYLIKHVHVALIYCNRVSKSSILTNLKIKTGLGYYLVPRKQELPYEGWINHHTKAATKVNGTLELYRNGECPADKGPSGMIKRSDEEKKRKLDDIIIEMRTMIEDGKEREAFTKFPRNYLTYGEKLKAMINQSATFSRATATPTFGCSGAPVRGNQPFCRSSTPSTTTRTWTTGSSTSTSQTNTPTCYFKT
jgi:hypothetical protein